MAFTYGEYSESGDYTIKEKVKYVKYLQSDGASYIDTGISYNNQSWGAVYKVQFDSINYWGTSPLSDDINNTCKNSVPAPMSGYSNYEITYNSNSKTRTRVTNKSLQPFNTTNVFEFDFNVTTPNVTIINGVECQTPTTNISSNGNMMLYWSPERQYAKIRIYELKLYQDGALVRDFKPCLDTKNIPCMYDLVTEQYFYNQGTGTFTVGDYNLYLFADNQDNVATNLGSYRLYDMKIEGDSQGVTEGIDYVDCLIGDGNSYIDTGIAPTTDYTIDIEFMIGNQTNRFNILYGSTGNTQSGYSYSNGIALLSVYSSYGRYLKWIDEGKGLDLGKMLGNVLYDGGAHINKKLNYSHKVVSATSSLSIYLFGNHWRNGYDALCEDVIRIYDFKIYNAEGTLIQHLRPCVDTSKVPCMYDEVSQQYFYNQGTGTFGYKKELRDFQPILDKNGIPCLMDKINRKYYYDKNGNVFNSQEEVKYRKVSYLQGDGASYIDTRIYANDQYKYEITIEETEDKYNYVFGTFSTNVMFLKEYGSKKNYAYSYTNKLQGVYLSKETKKTLTLDKGTVYEDGVLRLSQDASENTNTYTTTIWLFGANSRPNEYCTAKIYSFKIWNENEELVFDGIPALDQDNIPGIYDLVTETFFYNQGTGEFSYDIEELEAPPCNQVDCIYRKHVNNNDYFRTKNLNGLVDENLIIKTKIKLGKKDQNNAFFQIVGQYNVNRTAITYSASNKRFEACFLGNNCYASLDDYEVLNDDILEIQLSKDGLYVNNTFIGKLSTTNFNPSFVIPLYIFQQGGYQDTTTGNSTEGSAIYYITFEQNGEAVANFIPALDDEGVLCFYESVDGIYYYPTIGTSFSYNTKVSTPIKYIESDGTQYIDTGVRITNNTSVDMACRETTMIDYISDGLIFNLDGIKNTRSGHVSDTTVWEDLSSNGLDFNLNNITITDNSMSFDGSTSYANIQDIELWKTIANNTTEYDVELCLRFTKDKTYQPIISSNYGSINVAKFVQYLQLRSTTYGLNISNISDKNYTLNKEKFTVSCNMNDLLAYLNTTNHTLGSQASDFISPPTSDNFSIGTRLTGERFWFNGDIYSIRIYNRHLTDEERLYNHSVDVNRFGVETDIVTVKTGNYIMNNLCSQDTYKYQDNNTTVQSNLITSEGATLTLGETNLAYLSEKEIEDATNDGWNLL